MERTLYSSIPDKTNCQNDQEGQECKSKVVKTRVLRNAAAVVVGRVQGGGTKRFSLRPSARPWRREWSREAKTAWGVELAPVAAANKTAPQRAGPMIVQIKRHIAHQPPKLPPQIIS